MFINSAYTLYFNNMYQSNYIKYVKAKIYHNLYNRNNCRIIKFIIYISFD